MAATVQPSFYDNYNLPDFNRVKDARSKVITSINFPISELHYVKYKNVAARTITPTNARNTDGFQYKVRDCTSLLLPSEWAKINYITYLIFNQF